MDKAFQVARKTFSTTASKNIIQNVTIIGAGAMGSGIAQVSKTTIKYCITRSLVSFYVHSVNSKHRITHNTSML